MCAVTCGTLLLAPGAGMHQTLSWTVLALRVVCVVGLQRIESRVMRSLVIDENLRADGRCSTSSFVHMCHNVSSVEHASHVSTSGWAQCSSHQHRA